MALPTVRLWAAKLVRWIDGDTCAVEFDLGFRVRSTQTVRLRGCNAPEVRGPEKEAGLRALARAREVAPEGAACQVRTWPDTEKYGRWPGEVEGPDGRDVAEQLIAAGLATRSKP